MYGKCSHNKNHCLICHPLQFCKHHKRNCRKCRPMSWAKNVLSRAKLRAKELNYKAPNISALEILQLSKAKSCFACSKTLNWNLESPHLHHNHETGHVGGFIHRNCNLLEGLLVSFDTRTLIKLLENFSPEVFISVEDK
jgi:hypothetical protein